MAANEMTRGRARWLCTLAGTVICTGVLAQNYPTKSIRFIAPFPPGGTPEQFSEHIKTEIARWAPVVKASGAKPE